jgi:hypothetical protein
MICHDLPVIEGAREPLAKERIVFLIHSCPTPKDDTFSELEAAIKLKTITPPNAELLRMAQQSGPPSWLVDDEAEES